jgi:protein SCO1/2
MLTGDRNVIYDFARNELGVSVQPTGGGVDDLIHTQKLVLVDRDRHIRGYYDGLDSADLKRCADDIILLTLEKKKKKK